MNKKLPLDDSLTGVCPACNGPHEKHSLGFVDDHSRLVTPVCPRCGLLYDDNRPRDRFTRTVDSYDDLPEYELPGDEVDRRMPSLALIDDADVRAEVRDLTARAPPYYWIAPASQSGYHHPACRGSRGLWIHTLMLSTVIERLVDSYVGLGKLEPGEADLAHAAAILHDQAKAGRFAKP